MALELSVKARRCVFLQGTFPENRPAGPKYATTIEELKTSILVKMRVQSWRAGNHDGTNPANSVSGIYLTTLSEASFRNVMLGKQLSKQIWNSQILSLKI